MDGLIESGSRMFKHMDRAYFIRNFAGIRPKRIDPATGAVQDFVLECRDEAPGVVNLVGIESPASPPPSRWPAGPWPSSPGRRRWSPIPTLIPSGTASAVLPI